MVEISRTALVTGGAKRVGKSIVERLAAEGYATAIHCNGSRDDADALARSIIDQGGRACVVVADLGDLAAVSRIIPQARDALGPLSLLVNNASLFENDALQSLDAERWAKHFDVNLRAPCFLANAFAAQVEVGQGALADPSIVNVIDHRVWKLTPQFFSYTLTKSALWTATQTMAQSLAPRIRVNAIGPGPTLANHHDGLQGLEREAGSVPLQRTSPPEDQAEAVFYLARARSVTGQMIAVDAGQHLGWQTPDVLV